MNRYILFVFTFLCFQVKSQTIIMNEVSNGASGNQEYVEFVVVSNTVTYNCSNTTPPCIDIRGWIFDDNSGLHGGTSGTGVAPGAVRFSQNSIWACVPLGTIILLYNDADRNPAIPADDISMADGNCRIIAPISNTTLFESNSTTPGAVACSYPATGWTPGGDWNNTVLANSGDCARIVNLAGCEVFSVCYGTANGNNLIYYSGTGGQKVFYFNDTDPTLQSNWTSASASPSPGAQTPGAPNNAANAAYIAQFNNGCMPITALAVGTATTVNAGCTCNGSAKVNPSGSIGPYTYVWYDSNSLPIGQTSATATGLCAGAYKVVVTSHIGCKDSVTVNIASSSSAPTVTINNPTICSGGSAVLTATPSVSGGTYSWSPGGQTTQTISVNPASSTTYSLTYTLAGCTGSATAVVSVSASPTASVSSSSPSLCASGQTATLSLSGSTGSYLWSNGATTSTTSIFSPGVYTATVSVPGCGNATASVSIGSLPLPTVSIAAPSNSVCAGSSLTYTANSSSGNYLWSGGITTQTISTNAPSITVTTTNTCGSAQATQTLNVISSPAISVDNANVTLCSGQSATVTATSGAGTYTWLPGGSVHTNSIVLNSVGVYTVNTSNICGSSSATVNVSVSSAPTLSIMSSSPFICASGQTVTLSLVGSVGSYIWSTGATTSSIAISSSGVYSATVTTPGCGSSVANISLGVAPLPIVSISTPPTTSVCANGSVVLFANSNENNYLWPGGVTTQTFSANFSPVVVTSTNACGSSQATQTLNIIPLPALTLSTNTITFCSGQSATVQATANTAVTYSWSTGANTSSVSLNTPGVYTVNASNSCGTASSIVTASVTALPSVSVSATQTLLCSGQTAILSANGNSGSYLWSNGVTTATTTVINSGLYTATLTNACGQAVSSISVTALSMPIVNISPQTSQLCPGFVGTLTVTSNNAGNFVWSTGATTNTISVATAGIYSVTGSNLCGSKTVSASVGNLTLSPIVIMASSYSICPNQTATLTATGGDLGIGVPSSYSWSNSTSTGSVNTTNGGVVTLSVTNICGVYTQSVTVNVDPVNADLSATPLSGYSPLTVSFTNNSTNANTYTWSFGNGNTANTQHVADQVYNTGIYTVYLIASNGVCSDIDSVTIDVSLEEPTLYVPNAFTPNGDSINDVFYVGATNIISFNMMIFDRWGLQMFESNDVLKGWDGKINGKEVCDGTYFYLINATGIDNKEIRKQGTVTLFK